MPSAAPRPFDFQKDTFSFHNNLAWEYKYDANGKWTTYTRHPRPDYTQHCFILARATKQFFRNARFEPDQPTADETTYSRLVRRVLASNPRKTFPEDRKVIIPGYPDLRTFSQAHESLLKAASGYGWKSYFQRGHWRITFPFSRRHQAKMAQQLLEHIATSPPVVVHLVRFPQLTINHAVILFGATQDRNRIEFQVYDPNRSDHSVVLDYNRAERTFYFAANDYFPGGRLNVYEVYHKWDY